MGSQEEGRKLWPVNPEKNILSQTKGGRTVFKVFLFGRGQDIPNQDWGLQVPSLKSICSMIVGDRKFSPQCLAACLIPLVKTNLLFSYIRLPASSSYPKLFFRSLFCFWQGFYSFFNIDRVSMASVGARRFYVDLVERTIIDYSGRHVRVLSYLKY